MLLGSAAAWPRAVQAQQSTMPVIGFLSGNLPAFQQGLLENGYVEGRNVAIEFRRPPDGRVDRLPEMVADLVRRRVAVIVAPGIPGAVAAKSGSSTIPIVFTGNFDPVETGLVTSLSRPGGNLTGVTALGLELGPKRLEVLHELMPAARLFALLINPDHPNAKSQSHDMEGAARALGVQVQIVYARAVTEFDAAFANVAGIAADALVIGIGAPLNGGVRQLGELAARHRIPAIFTSREFVAAGGLASYGGSETEASRLVGLYVGRILKGEKPADLPVQQVTRVELFINLKSAAALGLTVPLTLRGRADELIE